MEKRTQSAAQRPAPRKQAITLKVAGNSYKFDIDPDREEIYRLAEREVNASLADMQKDRIRGWSDADYLAIAVLTYAIKNIDLRQSREVGDEDLKRLDALDRELGTYLDSKIE